MGFRDIIRLLNDGLRMSEPFNLRSADVLKVRPFADDTGSLNVGDGTTDMDVKWFGGATTKYVLADVGNSLLQLEDVDLLLGDTDQIRLGDGTGGDVALAWDGTVLANEVAANSFVAGQPSKADTEDLIRTIRVEDDFVGGIATSRPQLAAVSDGGTGTPALRTDTAGGVLNIVTAAADNDYHAFSSGIGSFDFVGTKEFWFEARFRLAEANTNESMWWFGVTSDVTTGGVQANALGPLATYDGFMIWKDEATMAIDAETSNAGTQDTETAIATFVTNTWTKVAMHISAAATTAVATMYYNVAATEGYTAHGTTMNLTRSGLVPGALIFGVKAGPSNGAETLQVDYVRAVQVR